MTSGAPGRYAAAAARLLRRLREEPPPSLPADRRRLVAAVEQALAARARRQKLVRRGAVAVVMAAAAAVVLVASGVVVRPGQATSASGASVSASASGAATDRTLTVLEQADRALAGASVNGAGSMSLKSGMILPAGIQLGAPGDAEVQLGTAAGTVMTMEATSTLTVTEAAATKRFALHGGAVRVRVAPLLVDERFLINTDDAEIEVHGTAFRVAVVPPDATCADSERTRVTVSEGVVTVRSKTSEVRLTPGSVWQSNCDSVAPATTRTSAASAASTTGKARRRASTIATSVAPVGPEVVAGAGPPALPPSVLAAQNDLFAAAVRARNQGRASEAVALFDRLLAEHPRGPLTESASVQRLKVLATTDKAAAARAAAAYLQRFPAGFARAEAQQILERR